MHKLLRIRMCASIRTCGEGVRCDNGRPATVWRGVLCGLYVGLWGPSWPALMTEMPGLVHTHKHWALGGRAQPRPGARTRAHTHSGVRTHACSQTECEGKRGVVLLLKAATSPNQRPVHTSASDQYQCAAAMHSLRGSSSCSVGCVVCTARRSTQHTDTCCSRCVMLLVKLRKAVFLAARVLHGTDSSLCLSAV